MANSYLSRTPTASDRKTMTFSVWVKRASLGQHVILGAGTDRSFLDFSSSDTLQFRAWNGASYDFLIVTNRKFLDTTSWYHIVVAMDTTQATDTNRVKVYINGVQETSFSASTYPSQNYDSLFNSNIVHEIGRNNSGATHYFDGQMAHFHFVDGTASAPTVFGQTDSTTGEWKPILNPSVTYGSNGFFLKFENAGALGTDSSGNSNTFTVNGDLKQSISTPSNNFCILDANQAYDKTHVRYGATAFLGTSTNARGVNSTQMVKNGKWYFEVKVETDRTTTNGATLGIVKNGTYASSFFKAEGSTAVVGNSTSSNGAEGISYQPMTATPNILDAGGGGTVNYGTQASANDIIMCAFDLDNGKIWFGKNGTWFDAPSTSDAGDPANGNYEGLSFAKGDDFWGVTVTGVVNAADSANQHMFCNFGEGRFAATAVASGNADDNGVGVFEYDVPAGFYAICTKNIKSYG
jgi:hypothetical protein